MDDNTYYYEMPESDYNEIPTPEGNGDKKKRKKEHRPTPKWLKLVCAGLIVGLVGGLVFSGTNYMFNRVVGTGETKEVGTTGGDSESTLTTSSSSSTDSDIAKIAEDVLPSIVAITNMSVQQVQDFFGGTRDATSESAGSGIIIGQTDDELQIVTNNHVVEGSDTLTVTFYDEQSVEANIKGTDATKDLAVIAVKKSALKDDTLNKIKVAQVGNSDEVKVGETAIAIGNALGYGQSVTTGIVSATNRKIEMDGFDSELIQTDAAINPGNSGGALLNAKGEVIGINTVKASDVKVEGIGYAIPITDASEVIQKLMNQETKTKVSESEKGYLGISGVDVSAENAQLYDMPVGAYVSSVEAGSGAEKAGLTKGSVITALNGTKIDSMTTLQEQLQYFKAGEKVKLTVSVPDKQGEYSKKELEVTLGTRNQ